MQSQGKNVPRTGKSRFKDPPGRARKERRPVLAEGSGGWPEWLGRRGTSQLPVSWRVFKEKSDVT